MIESPEEFVATVREAADGAGIPDGLVRFIVTSETMRRRRMGADYDPPTRADWSGVTDYEWTRILLALKEPADD